jgi:hypothetical protein
MRQSRAIVDGIEATAGRVGISLEATFTEKHLFKIIRL